ncbi:WD40/YVTN/BNR-like repeat-containing protein [Myxococcus stipitatus]|nr:hypothetical protein [Myxococcus stipitatus]
MNCASDKEGDGPPPPSDAGDGGGEDGGVHEDSGTDSGPRDAGGTEGDAGSDAGTDGGPASLHEGACTVDAWCWAHPTPSGEALKAVWSAGPSAVWAAGEGQVFHWNGQHWKGQASGVAGGAVFLSGSGADSVVLAGGDASVARWDGREWRRETVSRAGQVTGLTVVSSTEAWLTQAPTNEAPQGNVWRRSDTGWAWVAGLADAPLSSPWSTSASEVWALAGAQRLARWEGQGWRHTAQLPSPGPSGEKYTALWVAPGGGTGWAVSASGAVARWTGSGWVSVQSPRVVPLTGVWGSGANDVWLVGHQGVLLHWDGQSLASVDSGTGEDLLAISGTSGDDVWISGAKGGLLRKTPRGWQRVGGSAVPGASWSVVTGSASDNVWVLGRAGSSGAALVWNGRSWRVAEPPPEPVVAAWALSPDEVWAVGAQAYRWNGRTWERHVLPSGLVARGIHGTASDDVWIVGEHGQRALWRGTSWLDGGRGGTTLQDVWMASSTSAWAVGASGRFEFFGGGDWLDLSVDPPATLRGIWGAGEGDVWAVGDQGLIVHYDGIVFDVDTTSAAGVPLKDVWGSASNDVWAVGEGGVVLHYDGMRWRRQESGTSGALVGAWSTGAGAWVVGSQGQVLKRP